MVTETGLNLEKGNALWERAKSIIPGGNGLISKRPDRHVPDLWPPYFAKSKGCKLWDLDGNEFFDFSYMGLGSSLLGYCDDFVDEAVRKAVSDGVSSTLNAPEEVLLAEKLLALHPFAGGVKFARSGGEAMAIAVRIARAFSGKETVAFSGYHGWSDWYLAANLSDDDNLNGHLMPGLQPSGVPKSLFGTAIPFVYNDVEAFKQVVERNTDIGVIVIEGARNILPSNEFLNEIEKISSERNIVVIWDEITSGWRITDGGVCKYLGREPDIVVYGKGLGNGYAISAILGKKEIMREADQSFVSSTFWTERIGFSAALATIEKFISEKCWEKLIARGEVIGRAFVEMAQRHQIDLSVSEFKPLINFSLNYEDANAKILTLFAQEMLKRGFLAGSSVYLSLAHNENLIEKYLVAAEDCFQIISKVLSSGNIDDFLETSVRTTGFKRLT